MIQACFLHSILFCDLKPSPHLSEQYQSLYKRDQGTISFWIWEKYRCQKIPPFFFSASSPDDFAILNYLHLDKSCDIILQEDVSKIFHLSQQDIWYSPSITAFLPKIKVPFYLLPTHLTLPKQIPCQVHPSFHPRPSIHSFLLNLICIFLSAK